MLNHAGIKLEGGFACRSLSQSSPCCSLPWTTSTCKRSLIGIPMNRAAVRCLARAWSKCWSSYQMIGTEKLRGLIRTITEHAGLQAALGGTVALNPLSNSMAQRDVGQMVEAWMRVLQTYGPWLKRMGRKFARIAVVDASLIKLSLLAYSWAEYRKQRGAAKIHAVLEWARGIPQQRVVTTGKGHDLNGAARLHWARYWTYIFDRAYLGFDFLSTLREAGAHFVVRFKEGVGYCILERFAVPQAPATASFRLTSDWTIRLPGWEGVLLRLVSYRLPDGKLIRV